jgi:hypothetical protein
MRALPSLVDLFVLLTIFALVLFYAALGNSAPNTRINQPILIEVVAHVTNSDESFVAATGVMSFRPAILDADGNNLPGGITEVPVEDDGMIRFLLDDVPEGAYFNLLIDSIAPEAFSFDLLSVTLTQRYPTYRKTEAVVRPLGGADVYKLEIVK